MSIDVGIIMGSRSDWETMRHASDTLEELGVSHEVRVVSAHRTPDLLFEYADSAVGRGLKVIIAGAGGAAQVASVAAGRPDAAPGRLAGTAGGHRCGGGDGDDRAPGSEC